MNLVLQLPDGLKTMNPYMLVKDPEQMIRFVQKAFEGIEKSRTTGLCYGEITNMTM